jgi:hypothetical protein
VTRNLGASIFLTSENEWYKAAYYDALSTSYFDYPTGTNTMTGCVAPGSDTGNSANCGWAVSASTNVGAYLLSDSPYGTYDQGGNVWEWNEEIVYGSGRGFRGGLERLRAASPRRPRHGYYAPNELQRRFPRRESDPRARHGAARDGGPRRAWWYGAGAPGRPSDLWPWVSGPEQDLLERILATRARLHRGDTRRCSSGREHSPPDLVLDPSAAP